MQLPSLSDLREQVGQVFESVRGGQYHVLENGEADEHELPRRPLASVVGVLVRQFPTNRIHLGGLEDGVFASSRNSRKARIFAAIVGLICFSFFLRWIIPGSRSDKPQIGMEQVSQSIIELDGIRLGETFPELNETWTREEKLSRLGETLLERFRNLGVDYGNPTCTINTTRFEDTLFTEKAERTRLHPQQHISIALNLFNSERVLPSLSLSLLGLIYHLLPTHSIYISIFENDSADHTISMLGHLAAALISLKIDGLFFRHSTLQRSSGSPRITALANIRNEATIPLIPYMQNGTLLFLNDIICCPSDLLELPHQIRLQDAHFAMSTDWGFTDENGRHDIRLYDSWVARGADGELAYPFQGDKGYHPNSPNEDYAKDLFVNTDEWIHQRWLDGRPFPVYSGWNGAVAMKEFLFKDYHLRFRPSGPSGWRVSTDGEGAPLGKWGKLMAAEGYMESDCAASECKLIARDIWNLLEGKARVMVASQSRTVYNMEEWDEVSKRVPVTRWVGKEEGKEEFIDWGNVTMPSTVVCAANLVDGQRTGPFDENHFRLRLDPRFGDWVVRENTTAAD